MHDKIQSPPFGHLRPQSRGCPCERGSIHGSQLTFVRQVTGLGRCSGVVGGLFCCRDCRRSWFTCASVEGKTALGWLRVLVDPDDLERLRLAPEWFVRTADWYVEAVRQPNSGFDRREGVVRPGDPTLLEP